MGGMMGQLQKLQEQIQETQAKLAEETVTATAGGGAVKITVTGDQRCRAVEIDGGRTARAPGRWIAILVEG
jgi:DNA-binding protein YbaB